jgi:hypothetical protein
MSPCKYITIKEDRPIENAIGIPMAMNTKSRTNISHNIIKSFLSYY